MPAGPRPEPSAGSPLPNATGPSTSAPEPSKADIRTDSARRVSVWWGPIVSGGGVRAHTIGGATEPGEAASVAAGAGASADQVGGALSQGVYQ